MSDHMHVMKLLLLLACLLDLYVYNIEVVMKEWLYET